MLRRSTFVGISIAVILCGNLKAQDHRPFFVDFRQAANTGLEDDGVAGNGRGGWSDEGANDFFMYPPIEYGSVERNGYHFHIVDPSRNEGNSVIMLKGARLAGVDKPDSVKVRVPNIRGRYLYFLQNSIGAVEGLPENYLVATYVITYQDGSTADLPMRSQVEIRHWWPGKWWDNSEEKAWPIFMGRNSYSVKWKMQIAVWATQVLNPNPDRPISAIALKSEGKATPVIWAATITDDNYFGAEEARKVHWGRPPDPPAGYFVEKQQEERKRIFEAAHEAGHFKGLRRIELIRNDLLAVTVDSAIGGIGAGPGTGIIDKYANPATFTISSSSDSSFKKGQQPAEVGRQSREVWVGDIGPFPRNFLFHHTFYLRLKTPLKSGNSYTVSIGGIGEPFRPESVFAYDEDNTTTTVIKINQIAYSSRAARRYAYLGWWAGDAGKVDFSGLTQFLVVDEQSGKSVLEGVITLRRAGDVKSGEDVYELDLSPLTKKGTYHIRVPGLGCSDSFDIGGDRFKELYYHTMRSFFHQRCGQEFKKPYSTFAKPACHLEVYESGYLVENKAYTPKEGERKRTYRGGYHDAADFDTFTQHLKATAQTLVAYEFAPDLFKDGDLSIPESGNGVPDILDEANWALFFFRNNQEASGAVPYGRGNDCDLIREWERRDHKRPLFGVFPPTRKSSCEFAAVAAFFSRVIRKYDAGEADAYLRAAEKGYAWATGQPDNEGEPTPQELKLTGKARKRAESQKAQAVRNWKGLKAWAAIELFRATGKQTYHKDFKQNCQPGNLRNQWPYLTCSRKGLDEKILADLRERLIRAADNVLKNTDAVAYRMGRGPKRSVGWGTGHGGGVWGDVCLRAYVLTGEQKYLDGASLNADFQLGANPLSQTFLTGIGVRHPNQPQISQFLYTGPNKTGETIKGSSVYGLATREPKSWYPRPIPEWRRFRDLGSGAEICSEFTINETTGPSAILYAILYALEQVSSDALPGQPSKPYGHTVRPQ